MLIDKITKVLFLVNDDTNLDLFLDLFPEHSEHFVCKNAMHAYDLIPAHDIQLTIVDLNLANTIDFLDCISKEFPNVQRLLIIHETDFAKAVNAINRGRVHNVILKPLIKTQLSKTISEIQAQYRIVFEKEKLITQLTKQNEQFEFLLRQKLLS